MTSVARCRFLPYREAQRSNPPPGVEWIDVSSLADTPYDTLSPMYPHGEIPVPGMEGTVSDSVEGIWQGLKVIRGRIEPRFFRGPGRKRGGKPTGHRFGTESRLLKLEAARQRIYVPAYEWMLEHRVAPSLLETFLTRARGGVVQCFHDLASNGSMAKDAPLAHASVLVRWLNRRLRNAE